MRSVVQSPLSYSFLRGLDGHSPQQTGSVAYALAQWRVEAHLYVFSFGPAGWFNSALRVLAGHASPVKPSGKAIHRARGWERSCRRRHCCCRRRARRGGGATAGDLEEWGGGEGWPERGGWWAERPPARSPAAGVVEGGGGV